MLEASNGSNYDLDLPVLILRIMRRHPFDDRLGPCELLFVGGQLGLVLGVVFCLQFLSNGGWFLVEDTLRDLAAEVNLQI